MASSSRVAEPLSAIVASVLANPGLHGKAAIGAVIGPGAEACPSGPDASDGPAPDAAPGGRGGPDWVGGPGDDGAVLRVGTGRADLGSGNNGGSGDTTGNNGGAAGGGAAGGGAAGGSDGTAGVNVIACGEAILPAFVAADPRGAGFAAVLTNVNDLAAMGAVPLGIVDTVAASEAVAREVVAGIREGCALYRVPLVGGHLTIHDGPPALSAFGIGEAVAPLSVTRAEAGQSLVVAAALAGEARTDFPFFPAFRERGERCADDVRLLARLAADGVCVAAKDISMAGLLGSLAMLLECRGLGVTVDLDAVPTPDGVPLTWWLNCFPSYGFLLCVPPGREDACVAAFTERDLAAAVVGTFDASGELAVTADGVRERVLHVDEAVITGLPRPHG